MNPPARNQRAPPMYDSDSDDYDEPNPYRPPVRNPAPNPAARPLAMPAAPRQAPGPLRPAGQPLPKRGASMPPAPKKRGVKKHWWSRRRYSDTEMGGPKQPLKRGAGYDPNRDFEDHYDDDDDDEDDYSDDLDSPTDPLRPPQGAQRGLGPAGAANKMIPGQVAPAALPPAGLPPAGFPGTTIPAAGAAATLGARVPNYPYAPAAARAPGKPSFQDGVLGSSNPGAGDHGPWIHTDTPLTVREMLEKSDKEIFEHLSCAGETPEELRHMRLSEKENQEKYTQNPDDCDSTGHALLRKINESYDENERTRKKFFELEGPSHAQTQRDASEYTMLREAAEAWKRSATWATWWCKRLVLERPRYFPHWSSWTNDIHEKLRSARKDALKAIGRIKLFWASVLPESTRVTYSGKLTNALLRDEISELKLKLDRANDALDEKSRMLANMSISGDKGAEKVEPSLTAEQRELKSLKDQLHELDVHLKKRKSPELDLGGNGSDAALSAERSSARSRDLDAVLKRMEMLEQRLLDVTKPRDGTTTVVIARSPDVNHPKRDRADQRSRTTRGSHRDDSGSDEASDKDSRGRIRSRTHKTRGRDRGSRISDDDSEYESASHSRTRARSILKSPARPSSRYGSVYESSVPALGYHGVPMNQVGLMPGHGATFTTPQYGPMGDVATAMNTMANTGVMQNAPASTAIMPPHVAPAVAPAAPVPAPAIDAEQIQQMVNKAVAQIPMQPSWQLPQAQQMRSQSMETPMSGWRTTDRDSRSRRDTDVGFAWGPDPAMMADGRGARAPSASRHRSERSPGTPHNERILDTRSGAKRTSRSREPRIESPFPANDFKTPKSLSSTPMPEKRMPSSRQSVPPAKSRPQAMAAQTPAAFKMSQSGRGGGAEHYDHGDGNRYGIPSNLNAGHGLASRQDHDKLAQYRGMGNVVA